MKPTKREKIRVTILTLSLILFPVTFYYLSPMVPLMGAYEGIVAGSLIIFTLLFIQSLFLGRAFCSWVCPAGSIQDSIGKVITKPVKRRKINWIKYLVWGPWVVLLATLFRNAGGIKGVNFTYATENGLSTTSYQALIVYSIVVLTVFLLSLIIGRRSACHTICWISPFMIIGKKLSALLKLPSLKLKSDKSLCVSCNRCTNVCPMSINVEEYVKMDGIKTTDCILCGKCVDTCNKNAIDFTWK